MNRILIGITTEGAAPDPLFGMHGYTVHQGLYKSVSAAGGIPVALAVDEKSPPSFFDELGGLVLCGGGYAFAPDWYKSSDDQSPYQESASFKASLGLLDAALARNLPVLGVCAGMQLIAGHSGAKLSSRIGDSDAAGNGHWCVDSPAQAAHDIKIMPQTLLARLIGTEALGVNSLHREAVLDPAPGLCFSAISEDGVVEACEISAQSFCLGLQWHPELMSEQGARHQALFNGLIAAATEYSRSRIAAVTHGP